ncbi:hypothetical protein MKX03_029300, partial [Papaver bracteatum]
EKPLNHHEKSPSRSDISQDAGNASQLWRAKNGKYSNPKQLKPATSARKSRHDKAEDTFQFSAQKPTSPSQHHLIKSLVSPQPLIERLTTTLGGNMGCDRIGDKENYATDLHMEPIPASTSTNLAAPPIRSFSTGVMAKSQNIIRLKTIVRGQHSGVTPSSNGEQSNNPKRPKPSIEDRDTILPTLALLNTCSERVHTTDTDRSNRDMSTDQHTTYATDSLAPDVIAADTGDSDITNFP